MDSAEAFLRRCARPLDLLLWQQAQGAERRFEVLTTLAGYQNPDGGFGHGIEPDNLSPASTPMGTWAATMALRQVDALNSAHTLVATTVEYLLATRRPNGSWPATDPSTNAHPHAPWWTDRGPEARVWGINPTAALLGFLLRVGRDVRDDISAVIADYLAGEAAEQHQLSCAITLHADLRAVGEIPPPAFTARIAADVDALLVRDPARWVDYVLRPSAVFTADGAGFAEPYREAIAAEVSYLRDTQDADGGWSPAWSWDDYPEQWPVARLWWRGILTRQNLSFLARWS